MHIFRGKVRHGNKRGKHLGFPTANISLQKRITEGIYISLAKIEGKTYQSLTFIGKARTYNEIVYQAEVFLLDFDADIYGKWIDVTLLKKIRGNRRFITEAALIEEMHKDKWKAEEYFRNHPESSIIEK